MRINIILLACALFASAVAAGAAEPTGAAPAGVELPLLNPGMEMTGQTLKPTTGKATISGTLAQGWGDNSDWADVDVNYALDSVNPHSGASSQKIEAKRISSGAVQFRQGVPIKKDHIYSFSAWLRGQPGQRVTLQLRQAGAPYASYAETPVVLSAEWQQVEALAQVPADEDAFLMVRVTTPQTLWVDDVEFHDLTALRANGPAHQGNLLSGGSFESGVSFGWSSRVEAPPDALLDNPRIESATPGKIGARCLKFSVPLGGAGTISTPVTSANFGRTHTLSLWMRAQDPGTLVQIALVGRPGLIHSVRVGPTWQRVTTSFEMPFLPFVRIAFYLAERQTARTLWMDGVTLEERPDASPDYVPDAPHEMTLTMARGGNILFDGEDATANLSVAPAPPPGATVQVSYQPLGGQMTEWRDLPAAQNSLALPTFDGRRGMWKLRAQLQSADKTPLSSPVELVWARLPRPREVAPQNSFFGLHVPLIPAYLNIARNTGHTWNRLHDTSDVTKWGQTEPQAGQFRFYDQAVAASNQAGLHVLGMLDGAPEWTTTQPRAGYWAAWNIPDKPGMTQEWSRYVETVVGHYKGQIDDWEVWNEPWGRWWLHSGNPAATPEFYAELLRLAHDAAHRANPDALVVGVDTYPGYEDSWTRPVLRAARDNPFEALSFHDYNDAFQGGPNARPLVNVESLRAQMKESGEERPLWNTEGGPGPIGSFYAPQTGGLSADLQPAWIVRYDVTHMGAGVRRFFLYAMLTGSAMGETQYHVTEHDNAIRPILAARAVLAYLVDGSGTPTLSHPAPGVDSYDFPNGVRSLWSFDSATHTLDVPRGMIALDVWGNTLAGNRVEIGVEPIYLAKERS